MRIFKTERVAAFILFAATVLYIISRAHEEAALLIDDRICMPLRRLISSVSSLVAPPVFEILALLLPLIAVLLILAKRPRRVALTLLSVIIVTYLVTLGIPASKPPTGVSSPTREEYFSAAEILISKLHGGPTEHQGIDRLLISTRRAVQELCGSDSHTLPPPKQSLVPSLLGRLGILAYFPFLTAEAIVDGSAPAFSIPFSAAHELMHLMGTAREDEADFLAFVALDGSEEPSLRYSAALMAYLRLCPTLYALDREGYAALTAELPWQAQEDIVAYGDFLSRYDNTHTAELSQLLNDVAISARDERGSLSYSSSAMLIASFLTKSTPKE